jgi:hypothetical protein
LIIGKSFPKIFIPPPAFKGNPAGEVKTPVSSEELYYLF